MKWFEYPICVPFGNPAYDAEYGGAHDLDVQTPPNTPITALLDGLITDISAPEWGKQVCLQIAGCTAPYMAYLHLSAVNPALKVGQRIKAGDLIGWSGGATKASQYAGTSNPTGYNFLNDPSQSSQPQTGVALMHGPVYGTGAGWVEFPPIDKNLDPTPLIEAAIKELEPMQYSQEEIQEWTELDRTVPQNTGLMASWAKARRAGYHLGAPTTWERKGTFQGKPAIMQSYQFAFGVDVEGQHTFYDARGFVWRG